MEHKPHFVNWATVCIAKIGGGLGVRRLDILNRALLGEWNWRYAEERVALWHCVIKSKEQITHLLFADDTLVFCNDTREQLAYLSWVLLWFEAISGLKINLEKSSILPVGTVENLEDLAAELGCRKGNLPTTYSFPLV